MSSPLGQIEARSSVELNDSCNCCLPRLRRPSRRQIHPKPKNEDVVLPFPPVYDAANKTHKVSQPVLNPDGEWEVEIDGVKHPVK